MCWWLCPPSCTRSRMYFSTCRSSHFRWNHLNWRFCVSLFFWSHLSLVCFCCFFPIVGQNVPPGMAHPKRSQTTTADNSVKEDGGVQLRKPSTPGSRGAPPSSPLLGNANNPNKADIPDRRKGATTGPSVSVHFANCIGSYIRWFLCQTGLHSWSLFFSNNVKHESLPFEGPTFCCQALFCFCIVFGSFSRPFVFQSQWVSALISHITFPTWKKSNKACIVDRGSCVMTNEKEKKKSLG